MNTTSTQNASLASVYVYRLGLFKNEVNWRNRGRKAEARYGAEEVRRNARRGGEPAARRTEMVQTAAAGTSLIATADRSARKLAREASKSVNRSPCTRMC